MTRAAWNHQTGLIIRELMKPPITDEYIDALSSYLGADPALVRTMIHVGRCRPLTGNRIWDLREIDNAIRQQEKENYANTSSVR